MRFKPTSVSAVKFGTGIILQIGLHNVYGNEVDKLTTAFKAGNEYELRQIRKKRSLDANAYFWVLADKIAKAINTTKEMVYWHIVRDVGVFDTLKFSSKEAMERFKANWRQNGLGWVTRTIDNDKFILQAYYGSSRYSTKEMTVLIDEAVSIAKSLHIETLTPEELSRIKEDWK